RGTRPPRAPTGAQRRSTPGCCDGVARDRQKRCRLGRAVGERDHRAVVEVHVDAFAPAAERAAIENAAREHAGAEPEDAEGLTTHRRPSSSARAAAWRALPPLRAA